VLVADDDVQNRELLAALIGLHPSLELVGVAADADEAIARAGEVRPGVALVDVTMPGGGGARAAIGIRECSPQTRVLAWSGYDDRATVLDMLRAGAAGYLLKGAAPGAVTDAIVRCARGETILSPEVAGGVIDELAGHLQERERQASEVHDLRARIRHVIEARLFETVFQPIVDLSTGCGVGLEALTRFSAQPLRSPDAWFAEAGRVGLRTDLEVVAAASAIHLLDELPANTYLSINASAEALSSYQPLLCDAAAGRLVIEITEHDAIEDYAAVSDLVEALRSRHVRIAVDDVGAGFASLRHALQLEPHFIKLDVSLTRGIDQDRRRRALAAGLVGFASELGAAVVAEGIESAQQVETLRALGVQFGQGFVLAAPGPPPAATFLSRVYPAQAHG
jgi:EAL domain-containing protein (putative c-di-GMP-specific phosphodiesterase class I)/DNA-binding NarL/FixJ family response regulator